MGPGELERLVVRLTSETMGFDAGMNRVERRLLGIQKTAMVVGHKMTMYLTAPLAAMGAASVYQFAKFEDAMVQSTSIMSGVTDDTKKKMEDLAKGLSTQSTKGPEELARSYYFLASAGLDAHASMAALPEVLAFAEAGAFDMATATDLLTDAQAAFNFTSKDPGKNAQLMVQMSDALVKAGTQANASVQQFSEAMTNDAANAASQFGMDLSTTMAVLDAYAEKGKKGAEAGTLMGRGIRLLTKAYRTNGEVFKKYGIDVVDEATGQYRNYIDIIGDLNDATKAMTRPQRDATLELLGFAALTQKSITPIMSQVGAMKSWEAELSNVAGITRDIQTKQLESFTSQMKILWNQIKVVATEIGETLAPALLYLNKLLSGAIKWWRSLGKGFKDVIIYTATIIAAIGPLLLGVALLTKVVLLAVSGWGILTAILSGFAGVVLPIVMAGFSAVVSVLSAIISPIGLVTGLVLGLTAAWLRYTESGQAAMENIKGVMVKVKEYFAPLMEWLGSFKDDMVKGFQGMWLAIQNGDWGAAGDIAMAALGASFNDGMAKIMENWGEWVNYLATAFIGAMDIVRKAWTKAINWIGNQILKLAKKEGIMGDMARDMLGGIDLRDETVAGNFRRQQETGLRFRVRELGSAREGEGSLAHLGLSPEEIDAEIERLEAQLNSADFGLDMGQLLGGGQDAFSILDENMQAEIDNITRQSAGMLASWNEWSDPETLRRGAEEHRNTLDQLTTEQEELRDARTEEEERLASIEAENEALEDQASTYAEINGLAKSLTATLAGSADFYEALQRQRDILAGMGVEEAEVGTLPEVTQDPVDRAMGDMLDDAFGDMMDVPDASLPSDIVPENLAAEEMSGIFDPEPTGDIQLGSPADEMDGLEAIFNPAPQTATARNAEEFISILSDIRDNTNPEDQEEPVIIEEVQSI